ncbi:hypothetical protein, partial [Pontibacter anaerobius]
MPVEALLLVDESFEEDTSEGDNIEGDTTFLNLYTETAGSHSLQYVSTHSFGGSRSARFELRDTDPMVNAGT